MQLYPVSAFCCEKKERTSKKKGSFTHFQLFPVFSVISNKNSRVAEHPIWNMPGAEQYGTASMCLFKPNQNKMVSGRLRRSKGKVSRRKEKVGEGIFSEECSCSQGIVYNCQLVFMLRSFCSDSWCGKQNQPSSTLLKMDFHVRVVWFDLAGGTWSQNLIFLRGKIESLIWGQSVECDWRGEGLFYIFPLSCDRLLEYLKLLGLFSLPNAPTKLFLSMATVSRRSELSPSAEKWWGRESSERAEMGAVVSFQTKRDWNQCLFCRPEQCSHRSGPV